MQHLKKVCRTGFTLVEILVVLFLIGLVALPFTNMFLFGVQGSFDNAEHVLGYNLAREKQEEVKGLPFELIKSDYEHFREVFRDRNKYDEAYYNETSFEKYFSDVFTDRSLNDSDLKMTYTRLKQIYPKGYLKQLQTYPEDYRKFRRVVKVEQISESATPSKLKKVSVLVFDGDEKKIAEIVTLVGLYK